MVGIDDLKFLVKRPGLSLRRIGKMRQIMADEMVLREVFVEQAYGWLVSGIRENTTAIDIGAYKGESSIFLAMQPRIKRVVALEPMRDTFNEARSRIAQSPYSKKISIINKAVSDVARAGRGPVAKGGSPFSSGSRSGAASTTIDDLLEGRKNVVIKCDCEGEERFVFSKNCGGLENVYRIQMEYHDTAKEVSEVLRERGFKTRKSGSHKGVYYNDVGRIYAYR